MVSLRIDVAGVKEQADAARVFKRCGVELFGQGIERTARCPFHEDHRPSLSVNLAKKVYFCHACGETGDIIHFVAAREHCTLDEAACRIANWCGFMPPVAPNVPSKRQRAPTDGGHDARAAMPPADATAAPEHAQPCNGGNAPLGFALTLDPDHPYLKERGLSPEIIRHFGLGYCARGLMAGRVCVPIHRAEDGALVGYAGRFPGERPPAGTPRYLLPRGFRKSALLYNLNRVLGSDDLVIVEGFFAVFALFALCQPAVAPMGRNLSARQEALLRQSGANRLTLLLDGDQPGRAATEKLLPRLAKSFFVRAATLPDGAQPDTVGTDVLRDILRLP